MNRLPRMTDSEQTFVDLLSRIEPKEIAARAVEEFWKEKENRLANYEWSPKTTSEAIRSSFSWTETKEGHDFWYSIYDTHLKKEVLEKEAKEKAQEETLKKMVVVNCSEEPQKPRNPWKR